MVHVLTVALILLMTWICVLGTELSAHLQNVLILAQTLALLVFAVVALVRGLSGATARSAASTRSWGWLNPFGAGGAALTGGLLLGVFAYWGWESAVNLTEETRDSTSTSGPRGDRLHRRPAGHLRRRGRSPSSPSPAPTTSSENADEEEAIFALLSDRGHGRLGLGGAAGRGHRGDRLHPDDDPAGVPDRPVDGPPARAAPAVRRTSRRATAPPTSPPGGSASSPASGSSLVSLVSENALFDSITALSLLIAFYYALTGIACADLLPPPADPQRVDVPADRGRPGRSGALLLIWLLVESIRDIADPENSYTGRPGSVSGRRW